MKNKELKNDPWGSFQTFINDPDVALYVGKNFEKYKDTWTKIYKKNDSNPKMQNNSWHSKLFGFSFCWLAFLVWPIWFGYRKMFFSFLVFLSIFLVAISFEVFAGFEIGYAPYTVAFLSIGMFAKSLYAQHTIDSLIKIKLYDSADKNQQIVKKGSTSVKIAFFYFLIFLVVIFVFMQIAYAIYQSTGIGEKFWTTN